MFLIKEKYTAENKHGFILNYDFHIEIIRLCQVHMLKYK